MKAKQAALLLFATLIIACSDSGAQPSNISEATSTAPRKPVNFKVVLILKSFTNPFFVEMAKGARLAQKETGVELEIKSATPDMSAEQQIRLVKNQTKAQVSAIVISPVDTRLLVPHLKAAHDSGIKIVNIDEQLNPEALMVHGLHTVPYVGVDNQQAAYQAAKFIADKIGRPTQVAIIEGLRGSTTATERYRGAQRAFQENGHVRLVNAGSANWKSDEAYELARQLFKSYPKLGAVYCANDLMAIGVVRYLYEVRNSKVLVGGFDALEEVNGVIRGGYMAVTVDQQAAGQGYMGVINAVKLLRGEDVPKVVLIETSLVTASSLK